jgi:cold shock protein
MAEGTVKWFDRARGFGYITPDVGEQDVFVAHTALAGPLSDGFRIVETGARVRFGIRQGDRGPEAVRVAPLVSVSEPPAGGPSS